MRDFVERIEGLIYGTRVDEVMDPAEFEMLRHELSIPDMRPSVVDVTIDGWLYRMEAWGPIKIKHTDPENHRKEEISRSEFHRKLSDKSDLRAFGKWHVVDRDINKVLIYRDYFGLDGREYREEFLIEVQFKEEIKKAIKPKWFQGWF